MAVIEGSAVFTDSWNLLYEVISGAVLHPAGSTTRFIYSAFPDIQRKDFPGFPIVTVGPVNADSNGMAFGHRGMDNSLSSSIVVFSKRASDLDVLSDDVHDAIDSNRRVMTESGLNFRGIDAGGVATDIIGENIKIHSKEITANFFYFRS